MSGRLSNFRRVVKEPGTLINRTREFDQAVRTLYSQSISTYEEEDTTVVGNKPVFQTKTQEETETDRYGSSDEYESLSHLGGSACGVESPGWLYYLSADPVGFRGRGRPYIPQEILDKSLRRPGEPAQSQDPALSVFDHIMTGNMDDTKMYYELENYIFKKARGLADLEKMMKFISSKALESTKKASTVCKFLYVFSQDPAVRENLQTAFFGNLEKEFTSRDELLEREGPERYRNFIKWIMAVAHHFRNPLYAPFDELMLGLNTLAKEISNFNDPEDYQLFAQLNIRFYYYASLPCSNGKSVPALLGEQYSSAIKTARSTARERLVHGHLYAEQSHWLLLLLEVTRSSPQIDEDLVEYYSRVLPACFLELLPSSLTITLPPHSGREKYLTHINEFVRSSSESESAFESEDSEED